MTDTASEPRRKPSAKKTAEVVPLAAATSVFFERQLLYRDLLNALPAAIYTTDAEGRITFYNDAAVEFAGRRPALGEQWCVTWKLHNLDGTPLPHDECPMAVALKEGRAVRDVEAIAERPDGTRVTFTPYPTPLYDENGKLAGAVNMLIDITEQKAADDRQRLLVHEVNHRANNLLSVVQSIVRLTRGETAQDLRQAINGRIEALSRAHTLLAKSRWVGADLHHLVSEELAPYMGEDARAWVSGAMLPMQPAAAQSLALIIHELATNAAKYGALSTAEGRVHIDWRRDDADQVIIRWREEGGPSIRKPSRKGVGGTVIARAAAQLGGTVVYTWKPTGLMFELRTPASSLTAPES